MQTEPHSAQADPNQARRDGWVSIQNNTLHVEDPRSGGKPAVISADDSVSVYVNELPINGPTDVLSQTSIRIQLPFRTYPEYSCDFQLAPDLCSVDLTVHLHSPGYFYSLPDTPAVPELLIQAETREAPLSAFQEDIREEILHELRARSITQGFLPHNIDLALEQPEISQRVVETQPAVSAVNRLEYHYALPEPDPEAPTGFTLSFPVLKICKAGEALVTRVRSDESRPGINIYGETLTPVTPQIVPLKAGDRTVLVNPEESSAVARLEGVPSFNGREARIGGLDKRSGVLEGGPGSLYDIKSSLLLDGSISQQAQVWVSQHLEVSGDVSHSHLEAQEHVIIHGNVIRSQISAGGDSAARMRLREPVEKLYSQMEQILHYFKEVKAALPRGRSLDDKQLFLRVIKTQFPHLLEDVDKIWKLNQSLHQLHPRRTMMLKVVLANLLNLNDRVMDERSYVDWVDNLKTLLEDLLLHDALRTHVYLNYLQGSNIVSRGNIYILGEGCYNSELQAGGDIIFCGSPGYCREGSLKAEGHLYVPELGSPNGSRLKVQLELSSRLKARKIHPGVELRFGPHLSQHLLEPREAVEVSVRNGQIQFRDLSL